MLINIFVPNSTLSTCDGCALSSHGLLVRLYGNRSTNPLFMHARTVVCLAVIYSFHSPMYGPEAQARTELKPIITAKFVITTLSSAEISLTKAAFLFVSVLPLAALSFCHLCGLQRLSNATPLFQPQVSFRVSKYPWQDMVTNCFFRELGICQDVKIC
jgi:hypothetical protein